MTRTTLVTAAGLLTLALAGCGATTKSVQPTPLGNCPPGHSIKGNEPRMIYHMPGGKFYLATKAEKCFANPQDAEKEGFRPSGL